MSYREIHELPYQSGLKEKFVSIGPLSLSFSESIWVGIGTVLSYKMVFYVPPIPYLPMPYNYIHYLLPLLITIFFSKAKHPTTGLPLWKYIKRWIAIRHRQRVFYYRKSHIVKGGDRYI